MATNDDNTRGYYKWINGKRYGKYYYPRAKHLWTPRDIARLLIKLKKSGRRSSPELIAAVLDAFKLRSIICASVQIFVFLQNTAILAVIVLMLKLVKTILNLWQLFRSGALRVLRVGVAIFKFDIANTILSKILLRFIGLSLALDAIISLIGLYAELLVAVNPLVDILDEACSWKELAIDGVEIAAGMTDAVNIATEIHNNEDAISKAIDELMSIEPDINELNNEFKDDQNTSM